MVSSTERAMGPSLSSDQHSVIAPVRGTRPNVGRRPVTPQRALGSTMLPSVSLPIAKATSPAPVAAPGPALDPPEPSSISQGFIVWPPNQISLSASAPRLSLAISTAGFLEARHHRRILRGYAVAVGFGSVGGGDSGGVEQVLNAERNAVQRAAVFPGCDLLVGFLRLSEREFPRECNHATQFWVEARDAIQINVRQPFGTEFARLDPARKLPHGSER